jgi:hypothetical protein
MGWIDLAQKANSAAAWATETKVSLDARLFPERGMKNIDG